MAYICQVIAGNVIHMWWWCREEVSGCEIAVGSGVFLRVWQVLFV